MTLVLASVNPTVIKVFQVLHILAASYFGLGALFATILALQVPNTPTLTAKGQVMERASAIALRMIVPGVLLAGITGVILMLMEGYSLRTPWLLISIILYVAALALGGVSGPLNAKLRRQVVKEARSGKKPSADLVKALRSPVPLILTLATLAITMALVILMIAKMPA
jgi:uncharacterized membrane protein